jgi:hypothetical protein
MLEARPESRRHPIPHYRPERTGRYGGGRNAGDGQPGRQSAGTFDSSETRRVFRTTQ